MIAITASRIKKAILHPQNALRYLFTYFQGQWLRLQFKNRLLRFIFQGPKKKINFHQIKSGLFFIENKEFLNEIVNQDFINPSADRIVNNEFGFLGITPKTLDEIEWNKDIKSGHIWPLKFYLDLRENLINDYNKGWDIKNVWEISRFHYLIPLTLAFYKTEKEKYLIKWQDLISDWINKNPVYYGPNWVIAMEAAIRVCNWILSYEIIKEKIQKTKYQIPDKFLETFLSSLYEHGKFIFANLERAPLHSNHYLSDIVGLIYLGVFFRNIKEGKKWLNFSRKVLEKEIFHQVYDDGVDYEMSISYHRYKTELFLWAYWLLKINNFQLSKEFEERLLKMVKFVEFYTKPNGFAPQIGDSDDSRLHLVWEDFYNWEKRNHFAVLKLAQYVFLKESFKENNEELKIFKGEKSGFIIIKNKDFYFITQRKEGCYGKGGSHQHNDILSFEININGDDLIIDSGTFVYSADILERNKFRSTQKHNVCLIDNQEQNQITKDIFYYQDKNKLKIIEFNQDQGNVFLKGEIRDLERNFVIDVVNKSIVIKDKILKDSANLEWNFHLAPEIKIWLKKKNNSDSKEIILLGKNGKYLFQAPKDLNFAIIEDEVSPSYGVKISSKTLQFREALLQGYNKEFEFKIEIIK